MSFGHDQHRRSAAWDIGAGPRNYVTLVVTQAANSLSALMTIWLLTRLLGANGYGQIAAIVAADMRRVIAIYAAGALAAALFGVWRLRHLIGPPVMPNAQPLRRILYFSLPLIPQSLVSYFSTNYLDAWFILRYLSAADWECTQSPIS
jgi:O-antigen/teichoic acid export membrane protein